MMAPSILRQIAAYNLTHELARTNSISISSPNLDLQLERNVRIEIEAAQEAENCSFPASDLIW